MIMKKDLKIGMNKIIKESISFNRNEDSHESLGVGKNTEAAKKRTLLNLEKQGLKFSYYNDNEDNKLAIERYIKNIYEIEEAFNILKSLNINNIRITGIFGVSINIETYDIVDSNHVILHCVSEDDANNTIKILKNITIRSYDNFSIQKGDTSINLNNINWFVDLIKNRKKYFK